jgi:hypothetical protein
MYRNSGSPADGDVASQIDFEGRNDNSQDVVYGTIKSIVQDVSDGTEDGKIEFNTIVAGSATRRLSISSADSETVFNDDGIDLDLRVETNGNANAFFVDGGTDSVYFGANAAGAFDAYGAEIQVQILGAGTAPYTGLGIIGNTNDADAGVLILGKSRGTAVNATTIVQDNDQLGRISFQGMDGTDLETGADILAVVDGTPGDNDMPTELIFRTTADGADSSTSRMRIRSGGGVEIAGALTVVGATNLDGGAFTFNETGSDLDFRVESNGSTHALFVDGANGRTGINHSTPEARLEIDGGGEMDVGVNHRLKLKYIYYINE